MAVWLPLFWRTARHAGFGAPAAECAREAAWVAAALALMAIATAWLGPETALLAVHGPLIVLRYLLDGRPGRRAAWATARRVLPHAALIAALVLTRLTPALQHALGAVGTLAPFGDLPAWSPLLHAGSWLLAGGVLTALVRGQARTLGHEARTAWATGRNAVLTVFLFAMMAEVLSAAGISQAVAQGLFAALHQGAVLATPVLAGLFGILANSGNAPNSLFMPAQIALATQAGLSVPALAALQHVSGTSLSLFSPVRMSIAAGLANGVGQERRVYAALLPYAAACLALLLLMAAWIVLMK
jgi:lactate permease